MEYGIRERLYVALVLPHIPYSFLLIPKTEGL